MRGQEIDDYEKTILHTRQVSHPHEGSGVRCADLPFLSSCMRGGSELNPTPLRRILSHAPHSELVIVTTLEAFRQAESHPSSIRTTPSRCASRRARLTVARETPASAAI